MLCPGKGRSALAVTRPAALGLTGVGEWSWALPLEGKPSVVALGARARTLQDMSFCLVDVASARPRASFLDLVLTCLACSLCPDHHVGIVTLLSAGRVDPAH